MILAWLIVILLAGGVMAWLAEARGINWTRGIALATLGIALVLALTIDFSPGAGQTWLAELDAAWIPQLGVSFHLAVDGFSLLLIVLTLALGLVSVAASWTEIVERAGFFYANLLWTLAGVVGVFTALDLFLFFVFWEIMLVPMYFLISIWGHENRTYAAIKFFIFTQGSGLFMLVAILALVLVVYQTSGVLTFDYADLLNVPLNDTAAFWLMLGFFVAFAVKLPAVPFHTWLPDAHTEAPTAGSVILAGVLLKTGAYGLVRFVVPLFPEAALEFAPVAMALGVVSILYGAILAFAQDDFKRLVAYSSVSHMGFVLLGVFAWNALALRGAVVQMLAHGISTAALFMLAGSLQERLHTRDLDRMGGLWRDAPRFGAVVMFFAIASLGLPGMGNFVGEFLVVLGAWQVSALATAFAVLGIVAAAIYALTVVQRSFHGETPAGIRFPDLDSREMATMVALIVLIVALGVYPQPVLNTAGHALENLRAALPAEVVAGNVP